MAKTLALKSDSELLRQGGRITIEAISVYIDKYHEDT